MLTFWTPERDLQLQHGEASGLSATQIATLIGTTRSAVLGRSARLRGVIFQSSIDRKLRDKQKMEERKRREVSAIGQLKTDLCQAMLREVAIAKAHKAGATWRAIGACLRISKQRAQQLGLQATVTIDRVLNQEALAKCPYGPGGAYASEWVLRREGRCSD